MELQAEAVLQQLLQHLPYLVPTGLARRVAPALNVEGLIERPVRRIHNLMFVDAISEDHHLGYGLVPDHHPLSTGVDPVMPGIRIMQLDGCYLK